MITNIINCLQALISKVTSDAIFATITALAVVTLSGLVQWVYKWRRDNVYLSDLRLLLCEHLKVLLFLVDKRISGFEELARVSSSTTSDFVYTKVFIPSDFIVGLPQIDFFRAIRKGKRKNKYSRIHYYSKLIESTNFISTELPVTENQFTSFTSKNWEYHQKFTDLSNELLKYFQSISADIAQKGEVISNDPFLMAIHQITADWAKLPDKDEIQQIYTSFINPIRFFCIKHPDDPRSIKFMHMANDAHIAKVNRDRLLLVFGKYFQDEVVILRSRQADLQMALSMFSF